MYVSVGNFSTGVDFGFVGVFGMVVEDFYRRVVIMSKVPSKVVRAAPTRPFVAAGKIVRRKTDDKRFEVIRHDHRGLRARDKGTNRETLFDASYFHIACSCSTWEKKAVGKPTAFSYCYQ